VSSAGDHWFDRLSVRVSRRDALKAAVAGGAALTFPLRQAAPALAGNPTACQQGCNWAAHQRYDNSSGACVPQAQLASSLYTVGGLTLGVSLFGVAASPVAAIGYGIYKAYTVGQQCFDTAMTQQKADMFICLQPNCPGFDPHAKGGPCADCTTVGRASCCPDPAVVSGYSCCTLGCACAGDTGACHGSTTPC